MAELYYKLMKLARIKNTDDREAVAVEFLTEKGRSLPLPLFIMADIETKLYEVPVTDRRGNCNELCTFNTETQAERFVELLLLIAQVRDHSDMVESCYHTQSHQ